MSCVVLILDVKIEQSQTFPQIEKEQLYNFLTLAKEDEIEAMQTLREWWQLQQ